MDNEKIILGIDPGTNIMGYGLISCRGKNISLITMGVLKLSGLSNHALKLKKIFERVLTLIDEYHPDELAIEAPFYGKNVQSMLKLGRAQGVAMASALYRDIPITEYSPRRIKQSITGRGAASKEQVAGMLKNLVKIPHPPEYMDATDGLAVAVCHFFQGSATNSEKKYGSWQSFLNNNPGRISK
ncbi:MAG: crossover junction endodeoxyribonuclease RuvC [Bacteroidales bacterium]